MSFLDDLWGYFPVEDVQWLFLVTLFITSVVTVFVYLVQYFYGDPGLRGSGVASGEAGALLNWALSLKSWRCQWRRAWVKALNDEAKKPGSPMLLSFEEDGQQSSELEVTHVSSFKKSEECKSVRCQVTGSKLEFSLCMLSPMVTAAPLRYAVTVSPLQLQLDLQMRETAGEVQVSWVLSSVDSWDLRLTPSHSQGYTAAPSSAEVRDRVRHILSEAQPFVLLSSQPAQGVELKEARNKALQVALPPKPPRAHDWKLLVKNIRVDLDREDSSAAGSADLYCLLRLDDPPQRFTSAVSRNTSSPSWEQPFIFELSGRSKELNLQVLDDGKPLESSLVGEVLVPFNLVKKHPAGLQTFALKAKDKVVGSLCTEFTYLEPSEVRSWQTPTPAPAKKVEMDRTVMPCGTVVTTVTAVKSKPGRALSFGARSESPLKAPQNLPERLTPEKSAGATTVSKALSSSDTELMMLNGTDPVAEAAIRQLHESAKQKLKSPVKKSTIIISGVAKTPLSQDEEMVLMAGYAAAMDASMTEAPLSTSTSVASVQDSTVRDSTARNLSDPREGPSGTEPSADWDDQLVPDPDTDKKSALSLCISETDSKKRKGSFLHKSAKLFFRRRHQRKDPGMSQSHNDLVYLDPPTATDKERRTATFGRLVNRKLLPKNRTAANGSAGEPHA
ncbi:C2 domain-containing protein 2 [Brienomyrus brachyistius]|uniref:C2 domain-containing protein 2 n=1 Tax=Brienomyrus brachyistius TaxID=42636 RepID=UPI0020B43FE1|nr:C2 domain-containing protein 2 [Brienomyrus brachyistius]